MRPGGLPPGSGTTKLLTASGPTGASMGQAIMRDGSVAASAGVLEPLARAQAQAEWQRKEDAFRTAEAGARQGQMQALRWGADEMTQGSGQEPNLHAKFLADKHKARIIALGMSPGGHLEELGRGLG